MIKVSYDDKRNTLIIEFVGAVDGKQVDQHFSDIEKVLPKKGKSFKLLTDLSAVKAIDADVQRGIKKAMDFLNERGVTEVIRVIPDPAMDIGFNVMSIFHYSPKVKIVTLSSREEAQAHLS